MSRTGVLLGACLGVLTLGFASGCSGKRYDYLSEAGKRGLQAYREVCLTCHFDPTKGAVTGPPIAGSSRDLLLAKVLEGRYPPGYTPKRPGAITMPMQPGVRDRIDDIATFLGEVKP